MNGEPWLENAATLSPEQADLLASFLEEKGEEFGAFPLSFAQQRLWFLDRFAPGEAAYNIASAIDMRGALDRAVLRAALQEIVRRHEILRTVFLSLQGRCLQVVREWIALALPEVDLTGLPPALRQKERDALARREAERLFDLQSGPLLRVVLLTESAGEHRLVVTLHHIVSDGWSSRLLAREVAALYEAFRAGRPSSLPELPLQYADYAVWQREWLSGPALERLLAQARLRLAGLPSLELPADHGRPVARSLRGRRLPWGVSGATLAALRRFCEREGITLFAALVAALAALLSRISGQSDIALGAPSANRDRLEIEPLIGCFVNVLVLRLDLGGAPGYRELARQARRVALDAFALRELPFEKLVEELEVGRSLSHAPLVQVMLALQNVELGLSLPGLELRTVDLDNGTAKLDLTLSLTEERGVLKGWIEYSTDLFEAPTMARLAGHLERWLEGALAEPDRSFAELPLLSAAERHQLLAEWSETGPAPGGLTVHGLFAAQAHRTPERVALVAGERVVTYGELDGWSRGVAGWLRGAGVGLESRVGVCVGRSPEMVAALLGVLAAGGAFVPLDPDYPAERLAWMIEDAGIEIIVTEARLASSLPADGARLLLLEEAAASGAGETGDETGPEALAYVMYTSGSTGRPKGVGVPHRAIVRLVRDAAFAELGPEEVFLQLAPVSFDASTLEIWAPLLNGGRLVLYPPRPLELEELGEELRRHGVTTLWLTAGVFQAVVERSPGSLSGLRQLLAGGDVLSALHVQRLLDELPGLRVINGYGPTENTTFTCCHTVDASGPEGATVPIGRPVSGTDVYVVNREFRPVAIGVAGELVTGGDGLARGYLGRPELTAERFVPHPFSARPGGRLYRTGDLARWRARGELEFLGRIDTQVKVRGFRIEPGEIESALRAHPAVGEAVVVARGDAADRRLVAYVTAAEAGAPSAGALREHLRGCLPEYMVPSAFVVLEALPLTLNGKVDRRALPEPDLNARGRSAAPVAPRTPVEEVVAQIWAEVLRLERVGIEDDFFELGGHSLLATQVTSRLRGALSVDLPLRSLFETPTVAGLAREVERLERAERGRTLPPLLRVPREAPLPLSFAQQRLWFLDQLEPGNAAYNIPVVMRLLGKLEVAALGRSLCEVVRRHEALRTVFVSDEDEPVQVILPPPSLELPVVDLAGLSLPRRSAEMQALIDTEALRPFDLARGPLLRSTLLRLAGSDHVVLVTMHHIVSDGWSMDVLLREVTALYAACMAGRPSPLPELPIQYADYAAWQRGWLQGEVLEEELAYWRNQLAGAPALLELPADRPRPVLPTLRGASLPVGLPEELSRALVRLGRLLGATPFMVLLAGFQALLARYSGSDDVAVGSPIAGRNRLEIEGLIGFFVNTLVLRTRLSGHSTMAALLGRVRETVLEAYAHQDLPFERLVEEVAQERSLAYSPLFQVLFALQNVPQAPAFGDGSTLRSSLLDPGAVRAKFDLSLMLVERESRFEGMLNYSVDLFDRTTVARFAAHLQTLLAGAAARPETPVRELPLLGESERHQLLVDWSEARPAPGARTVHGLFAEQARRTPERVALLGGGREIRYGELDVRSGALARRLRSLGVGPEVPVGVCLERTPELVVALLGVMRAGGCYVPLDPAYPEARRLYMLADSGARLLLTEEGLSPLFRGFEGTVLLVDAEEDPTLSPEEPGRDPELAGSLAYVIYTSGSTGRPKGVAIEHRSASALLLWARDAFSGEDLGGVLASTSICFDLSVFELFAPLAWGGRVVLVQNALELAQLPASSAVSLVNTVPSAMGELLDLGGVPASVRTINLAGEPLAASLAERLCRETSAGKVLNLYGPTEDTTYSTCGRVTPGASAAPSIGRAIDGTRAHVVDGWGGPAPVGVAGELLLGGAGLARGYLGRPDLTAERFVPDPFGPEPGGRLYRTGDLVRWRARGELEFLGRIDAQVKVRGFRIELGEIESALRAHPAVRDAAVVARGDGAGRSLVAYVTAAEAGAPSAGALREHLRGRLPEYMVPSAFGVLAALPLTPNGKVDRKELARRAVEPSGPPGFVPPRAGVEEALAGIWAEVLGLERVSAKASFFEAGGHSLVATRVVSRVRSLFRVELPVHSLFEAPVLSDLAARIEAAMRGGPGTVAPRPIARAPGAERALSSAQERLWFLDQLDPGGSTYNIPAAARVEGALHVRSFHRTLAEASRRHETLRTRFPVLDGRPLQEVVPLAEPALPLIDLRSLAPPERAEEAQRWIDAEAHRGFDLATGPLWRFVLIRLADEEHVFVVTAHHSVSDGWSMSLLFREIAVLYQASVRRERASLPELPVSYGDYAVWQREWLQGEEVRRQLARWLDRLAGAPGGLELPTDRPRRAVQSFRGGRRSKVLARDLADALRSLARQESATVFMVLLAAFGALLERLSGQDDLLIGTPVAGRNRVEIEDLIGCFLNTLTLRLDLSGGPSFRELLARVREEAFQAYAHQDVPFELLLQELEVERDLSRTPLFQVFFNMLTFPSAEVEMPGLRIEPIRLGEVAAKFDLTLYAAEREDGIVFDAVYNSDLFDPSRIEEMLEQLEQLLREVAADPDTAVGRVSLVTRRSREILSDPAAPLDASWQGSVAEVFARQVRQGPDRPAVIDVVATWTYGELEALSNQVANRLIVDGIAPGERVAILAHRSAPLVRAVLGTMKAGAAFVLLDPAYPMARLAELVRLAGPRGWLQVEGAGEPSGPLVDLLETLPLRGRHTIGRDPLPGVTGVGPAVPRGPDDLAYIAFTSGSTGEPKGTAGRHGSLSHFIPWQRREFGFCESDRFSALSGLAHDPLHRDLFTPLQVGAAIVIPDPERLGDPGWLASWVRQAGATVAHLTPAMGQLLAEAGEREGGAPLPLRWAFFVGDVLSRRDVARLRRLAPAVTCVNYYGSTETQRAVAYHVAAADEADGAGEILPLGRGIPDVQLLVLNRAGALSGIGELGEVSVRSPHIALGYLNDSRLTAERFVVNPFTGREDDRLYRTGDLGRYLPDGEVTFAGRADQQVKIRGFRIELGEIEGLVGRHPAIREAAVVVREEGEKRLACFFVPRDPGNTGSETLRRELRRFIADRLPAYMVPAELIGLEALPLTPNRKLDRRALVRMIPAGGPEVRDEALRTEVETLLAAIWSDLLPVERVGAQASFFEAGGHSLLATRLMSRVRDVFGVELPVRTLFEVPVLSQLAEKIEEAMRSGKGVGAPPLLPLPPGTEPVLSFAQQRLWFLDQMEPGSAAYNLSAALLLSGHLDVQVLARSLGEILRRHEILRLQIGNEGGRPVVQVLSGLELALTIQDLGGLPEGAREAELRRSVSAISAEPFDLSRAPLLRLVLLRLESERHAAVFVMHHIVSDGWSTGVLVRELSLLYEAFFGGRPSPLPELPVQYTDFARWQRDWLQGEALEAQLGYWRSQLAGVPPLDLPTDRPRPPVQTFRGATRSGSLDASQATLLAACARSRGATLFMALLAGVSTLLCRYSGQPDVAVGSPIANRTRSELEGLIGFFANTLVLRLDLSGDPEFAELVEQARQVALMAYLHQDVPFEKVVDEVQPQRDLSRSPLFQVMLILQNAPLSPLALPGLTLAPLEHETGAAKFDLTLSLRERPDGLAVAAEYNTDLIDGATIERLVGHLLHLLGEAAADPKRRLSELALLGEAERLQLLRAPNDTFAPLPEEPLIHRQIELQIDRTPEAPALLHGERVWTYRELEESSNRLAHHLRRLGAGPEQVVGIHLEHSPEMVIALLGVLKAGAAYLPLDPAFPRERLAYMVEGSAARILVTQASLVDALPAPAYVRRLVLDREPELWVEEGGARVAATLHPGNLAYLIYTSGSTGSPKAVLLQHLSVVNFLASMRRAPGMNAADTLLSVTSLSFDIAVLELLLPLTVGARVIFVDRETATDGRALGEVLESRRPTVVQATPATWRVLLEAGWQSRPGLKILCGGEALPRPLADRLLAGGAALWNLYGPTETTVWSAVGRVEPAGGPVPLGEPIANTELYLLDRWLEPVPLMVAGELCIGGAGLARGYHDLPATTAERFVPDAYATLPGARLYRTGDLVRRRSDGSLEFLGRIDHQVKVRGYRIEPGEIENALERCAGVAQAVVVVRPDAAGEPRLVAYVEPSPGSAPTPAGLRALLRETLPLYMVPSLFVLLDELPLTPNRKVDRRRLPAPESRGGDFEVTSDADAPIPQLLAGLFGDLLDRESVGVHEDFFALGGHSLLATAFAARARKIFGVDLPVRALFENPTAVALARIVTARLGEREAAPRIPPIERRASRENLPLLPSQLRMWFLERLFPDGTGFVIPSCFHLHGRLDVAALERSAGEILRRHEILRVTFAENEGVPFQSVATWRPFRLPVVDLAALPLADRQEEALRLTDAEAHRCFDLARGPLLRMLVLRLAEHEHVAVSAVHHIVSDGWSQRVFLQELSALYGAYSEGQPSPLPEPALQYLDYADWQRRRIEGEELERQLSFWRRQLGGELPALRLPGERTLASAPSLRAASQPITLSEELGQALRRLGRREGATPFMVLLAGLNGLLHLDTGAEDLVIGTNVANRGRPEIEGLIGPFVNTLALRSDLSGGPTFRQLVSQVRDVVLGAIGHQDVPFETVIEDLRPRRLGMAPLFRVMFVLQEFPLAARQVPGLTLAPFEVPPRTANFDLILFMAEREGRYEGSWVYRADLFDFGQIARMSERFERLLREVIADPDVPVASLWMPGGEEVLGMVTAFNDEI